MRNTIGVNNSFFGKHHTNESKDRMIFARDGKHYTPKSPCKCGCGQLTVGRRMYVDGHFHSNKGQLVGDKNPAKRPGIGQKISDALAKNTTRGLSISRGKTGKKRPDLAGDNNPAKRPEVRAKIAANNSMKRKEIVAKQVRSMCAAPNFPEKYLFDLIDSLFPNDYQLNTRGEVIRIGNKRPDIVNVNGQNKVIDHFGRKWHKPEEELPRITHFREFGFDCLIIWNEEFKDLGLLKKKLMEFHKREMFNDQKLETFCTKALQ